MFERGGSDEGATRAEGLQPMERYDIIRALGIDVLPAPTLTRRALLLDDEDVALVRPDLPDHEH